MVSLSLFYVYILLEQQNIVLGNRTNNPEHKTLLCNFYHIYNRVYQLLFSMARLVRKEDRGPMEVKVGNVSKWICMCGLSSNQPLCDGSHKKTADEEAGKVYRYNPDGTRTEIQ